MIQVKNLSLKLGVFDLRDVSLEIPSGNYFALLGPTGAGKTVLVECIVGIYRPDVGEVWIDGTDVTDFLPEERNIGYMPQDYALFPNMTVEKNIAFGLKIRKMPAAALADRVRELTDLLNIGHLLDRYPLRLSGGEKQRVALARALAPKPSAIILDEPLSALDESMRASFCKDLRCIQMSTGATFIQVSHSFEETIDCADKIAILNEGTVIQVDTVDGILRRPKNEFMANFVRSGNIYRGQAHTDGELTRVSVGGLDLYATGKGKDGDVFLTVRPEEVFLTTADPGPNPVNVFQGQVKEVADKITFMRAEVDIGIPVVVYVTKNIWTRSGMGMGDTVYLTFEPSSAHVF
jgi:ABC-type Fe3+/spermidine/putrescine transport system ATPase subunit